MTGLSHQSDANVARLRREVIAKIDAVSKQLAATTVQPGTGATVQVANYGLPGTGDGDATGAIVNAISAAGPGGIVELPPGTLITTSTILYPDGITIRGAGSQSTVVDYQGSGYAFASANAGSRSYNQRFEAFQVTVPAGGDGGISMVDVSLAQVLGVVVQTDTANAGYGFHVESNTSGFAVYNLFQHSRSLSNERGFNIAALGSNDTHLIDCRTANCSRGVSVVDSNHAVMIACAFESGTTGVYVEATSPNIADNCTMIGNRFEGNSTANIEYGGTAANIRRPLRVVNAHVDGTNSTGTPSLPFTVESGADEVINIATAVQDTPFRLERDQNGGSNLPALYVVDSNAVTGTPNTIQASAGRHAGHVFSGGFYNAGAYTENWFVDADGNVTAVSHEVEDVHVTSGMEVDADALIQCGDGSTAGNMGLDIRRNAVSNSVWLQMRQGSAASGLRWSEQFTSSDNVDGLVYSAGSALSVPAYRKVYSGINGRAGMAVNRIWGGFTQVTTSDVTGGGFGAGSTLSVDLNSTDMNGEFTVTGGVGAPANSTVALVYTDGGWGSVPFVVSAIRGGTGFPTSITGITWVPTTTGVTWTLLGTLGNGETLTVTWMVRGGR